MQTESSVNRIASGCNDDHGGENDEHDQSLDDLGDKDDHDLEVGSLEVKSLKYCGRQFKCCLSQRLESMFLGKSCRTIVTAVQGKAAQMLEVCRRFLELGIRSGRCLPGKWRRSQLLCSASALIVTLLLLPFQFLEYQI